MTANVSTNLASWSTTESSNAPAGTDSSDIDAEFRMIQKVVRQYLASKGADIASGATVDLSAATGNYVHVTGTTTITALGTVSAGMRFMLVFDGALTFTHNATSLILPGAANITTAAGDRCEVVSLGSGNWRCFWFTRASGLPVVGSYLPLAGGTMTGDITMSGASIFDANASIAAHATTMEPWSLGNYVTLTGAAVNFTAMVAAPQAGAEVELYMNAAHTFTDGAVFEVDGDANWTAAAGDRVLLRAKSTTVFTVHPRKKDGTAAVSSGGVGSAIVNNTTLTLDSATHNTHIVRCTTAGAVVTFPAAASNSGMYVWLDNATSSDTGVRLLSNGGLVGGAAAAGTTTYVPAYTVIGFQSDGANWLVFHRTGKTFKFDANGTWYCPPGVFLISVSGRGGGSSGVAGDGNLGNPGGTTSLGALISIAGGSAATAAATPGLAGPRGMDGNPGSGVAGGTGPNGGRGARTGGGDAADANSGGGGGGGSDGTNGAPSGAMGGVLDGAQVATVPGTAHTVAIGAGGAGAGVGPGGNGGSGYLIVELN